MKTPLKIYSVRKKKDIDQLQKGSAFFTKHFILKTLPNNLNIVRFLIVVSNKVSKSAVVRNKIRRIFREFLRNNINNLKPGVDLSFSITKNVVLDKKLVDKEELINSIVFALKKTRVL